MPTLPDQMAFDATDDAHPFRLVAAPARSFLNTSFTETPGSHRAREAADGAHASRRLRCARPWRTATACGSATRAAASSCMRSRSTGVQRGVVIVEGIWPNAAFEEGIGINTLVSAEPGYPNGGGCFHDNAIWVRAA